MYRTPVVAFRRGRTLAVAVLYGEDSDWLRNVLSGGGRMVRAGRTYELINPRVVPAADSALPLGARALGRLPGKAFVAELSDTSEGFGRGPAAT